MATGILGEYWFLFIAFFVFNIFDFITGTAKARQQKTESSRGGLWGIVKKIFYWFLITTAFLMANIFIELGYKMGADLSFTVFLGWYTLAALTINEARSILENLVILGVPVPKVLTKGLLVAKRIVKTTGENLLPKDEESEG